MDFPRQDGPRGLLFLFLYARESKLRESPPCFPKKGKRNIPFFTIFLRAGDLNVIHISRLDYGSPCLHYTKCFILTNKSLKKSGHPLFIVHTDRGISTYLFTPSKSCVFTSKIRSQDATCPLGLRLRPPADTHASSASSRRCVDLQYRMLYYCLLNGTRRSPPSL